jgi:hypothetical protein
MAAVSLEVAFADDAQEQNDGGQPTTSLAAHFGANCGKTAPGLFELLEGCCAFVGELA